MQPDGHVVTWEEFWTTFRAHHIPEGLIERKCDSSSTCKLDILIVSVKYVFVSVKFVYVCVKLLKI
jgi:hypothetical protein